MRGKVITDRTNSNPNENPSQPDAAASSDSSFGHPDWDWLLRQIEREIVETLDLEQVLTFTIDAALRATGAHEVVVVLTEPPDRLRVVKTFGKHYQLGIFPMAPEKGLVGRSIMTRKPVYAPDVTAAPDYVPFVPETRAQMALPIIWRKELLGVLNLETIEPSRFTEKSFQFLQLFMDRVALALDNARAHQTVQRQVTELRSLYDRVRALERLKSTLLNVAAHDLRNPIGAIRNMTELLLEDPSTVSARQDKMLKAILTASNDSLRIIEDLLVLQRVDSSNMDATFRALDLSATLRAVVDKKQPDALSRSQSLETDISETPNIILGDSALLREALTNLIDNAIKYTPEGGTITVGVRAEADEVHIDIVDTGYGLEPNELESLFQPFYRAPSIVDRGIKGTGLGLHIVKQIIEQHGGRVSAVSALGKGSTFTISLPLLSSLRDA